MSGFEGVKMEYHPNLLYDKAEVGCRCAWCQNKRLSDAPESGVCYQCGKAIDYSSNFVAMTSKGHVFHSPDCGSGQKKVCVRCGSEPQAAATALGLCLGCHGEFDAARAGLSPLRSDLTIPAGSLKAGDTINGIFSSGEVKKGDGGSLIDYWYKREFLDLMSSMQVYEENLLRKRFEVETRRRCAEVLCEAGAWKVHVGLTDFSITGVASQGLLYCNRINSPTTSDEAGELTLRLVELCRKFVLAVKAMEGSYK